MKNNNSPKITVIMPTYERDLHNVSYKFDDFYYPPLAELGYKAWSIAKRKGKIIIGLGKQDETI